MDYHYKTYVTLKTLHDIINFYGAMNAYDRLSLTRSGIFYPYVQACGLVVRMCHVQASKRRHESLNQRYILIILVVVIQNDFSPYFCNHTFGIICQIQHFNFDYHKKFLQVDVHYMKYQIMVKSMHYYKLKGVITKNFHVSYFPHEWSRPYTSWIYVSSSNIRCIIYMYC